MALTRRGSPLLHAQGQRANSTPVVLALVLGAEERRRVCDAVRDRAVVRFVERIEDVMLTLRNETQPMLALLVEPYDRDDRKVAGTVCAIRQRMPALPIIGYCRAGHEHSASIRDLVVAGVHELVFRGVDDSGVVLRSVLGSATHACAADAILADLLPILPPPLHPFAQFCISNPQSAHTVSQVANALGVNRKTLVNYCARAHLPPPASLLAWCRLLVAAHYLVTTPRTVEKIALQLDFPSDTALRNMIKRYTGVRAQELRNRGGPRFVLARLSQSCAAHRASPRAEA